MNAEKLADEYFPHIVPSLRVKLVKELISMHPKVTSFEASKDGIEVKQTNRTLFEN